MQGIAAQISRRISPYLFRFGKILTYHRLGYLANRAYAPIVLTDISRIAPATQHLNERRVLDTCKLL